MGRELFIFIFETDFFTLMVKADVLCVFTQVQAESCISQNDFPIPQYVKIFFIVIMVHFARDFKNIWGCISIYLILIPSISRLVATVSFIIFMYHFSFPFSLSVISRFTLLVILKYRLCLYSLLFLY